MTGDAPVPRSGAVFDEGLDVFTSVVDRMQPSDWDRPTPCDGWAARDVLGHLGNALRMGIAILRGESPAWPDVARPGDLVDGDPSAYWHALADEARAALEGADPEMEIDTPMGRRTVNDGLAFPAVDLYVHAWDLGRAAGIALEIPETVIAFAHAYIDPMPDAVVRGERGAFGPALDPPPDATPTEAFIAWTGRDPG